MQPVQVALAEPQPRLIGRAAPSLTPFDCVSYGSLRLPRNPANLPHPRIPPAPPTGCPSASWPKSSNCPNPPSPDTSKLSATPTSPTHAATAPAPSTAKPT